MKFVVANTFPLSPSPNTAYLINDNWNDWWEFTTLYNLYFIDNDCNNHSIGYVKIGQFDMPKDQMRADLPESFKILDDNFFSLGQDKSYYETLKEVDNEFEILNSLNDIAYDLELFEKSLNEKVTKVSLLREIAISTVKGQFNRLAHGGVTLTDYNFTFTTHNTQSDDLSMSLSYIVKPKSNPPTNVHVIIGRNGVGKTYLLNNMLNTLLSSERTIKYGIFDSNKKDFFANIVFVSFSAFDEAEPMAEQKDKTKGIQYSYIGLKRIKKSNDKEPLSKTPYMLSNEFIKSLQNCQRGDRKDRWINAINTLESDPIFQESEIKNIISISDEKIFKQEARGIFKKLSSGHKIVLLTVTRLVETVQEKTLVMLDEPESHLHPPLLAAFVRSLSELLVNRNGVAIIATHSPVVLQEVPKVCVSILNRSGLSVKAERPTRETFGENVGVLTHEVFGLEVTKAGFYNLIKRATTDSPTYQEILEYFNAQLGSEAKAICRALINMKNDGTN